MAQIKNIGKRQIVLTVITVFVGLMIFNASKATVYAVDIETETSFLNLLNTYVDPEYHLLDEEVQGLSTTQIQEMRMAALKAAKGCNSDYDRIRAVTEYVAENVYYDYYYYNHKNSFCTTFWNSYDVHKKRRTVCKGYSNYTKTLLNQINIPCMILYGKNHAFNAAYAKERKKWVIMDVTWCSKNQYTERREWVHRGHHLEYFNMSAKQLASMDNHEGYKLQGIIDPNQGDMYYNFYMGNMDATWENQSEWYLTVADAKKKEAKAVARIGGYPVTRIENYAFYKNKDVVSLDFTALGHRLTALDEYAFFECASLKTVKIPASVTQIGKYCFYQCTALRNIKMAHTKINTIEDYAFTYCSSLRKVTYSNQLEKIGNYAFYGDNKLSGTLNLSKTRLKKIGCAAFYRAKRITVIRLPKTIKKIDQFAFYAGNSSIETKVIAKITKKKLFRISGQHAWYNRSLFYKRNGMS